jgi:hypothetical protein
MAATGSAAAVLVAGVLLALVVSILVPLYELGVTTQLVQL